MNIYGLQKLTLLDYPGKTACTIFLAGCNMKCPFCHNSELINGTAHCNYKEEDIFKFLESRKNLLDGVCITGGEPLTNYGLFYLLEDIKVMGFKAKLDTNGSMPDRLAELISHNLVDYIAMDIKNSLDKYPMTVGRKINLDPIKKSIDIIKHCGVEYEFRTTVVDNFHEPEDFYDIGNLIQNAEKYYLQSFVMRGSVIDKSLKSPSIDKLEKCAEIARTKVKYVDIRGV